MKKILDYALIFFLEIFFVISAVGLFCLYTVELLLVVIPKNIWNKIQNISPGDMFQNFPG